MSKKGKRQKIEKEIEKVRYETAYHDINRLVEIPMPPEQLDKVAEERHYILEQQQNPDLRKKTVRRQERLLKKIFKAATQVLTENQYSIFIAAYAYQLPDTEIAKQIGRHQTYVTQTLRNSIKKIQTRLRVPISLKEFSKNRSKKTNEE